MAIPFVRGMANADEKVRVAVPESTGITVFFARNAAGDAARK
jgi:hypothetical protein